MVNSKAYIGMSGVDIVSPRLTAGDTQHAYA